MMKKRMQQKWTIGHLDLVVLDFACEIIYSCRYAALKPDMDHNICVHLNSNNTCLVLTFEIKLRILLREVLFLFFFFNTEVLFYYSQYWEKAEFPFHIVPKLASLNVAGGTIRVTLTEIFLIAFWEYKVNLHFVINQGYGCPGLSITASALATLEVARVDASCSTFILVHSSLAMLTIGI